MTDTRYVIITSQGATPDMRTGDSREVVKAFREHHVLPLDKAIRIPGPRVYILGSNSQLAEARVMTTETEPDTFAVVVTVPGADPVKIGSYTVPPPFVLADYPALAQSFWTAEATQRTAAGSPCTAEDIAREEARVMNRELYPPDFYTNNPGMSDCSWCGLEGGH
jgi:hypothetical protein